MSLVLCEAHARLVAGRPRDHTARLRDGVDKNHVATLREHSAATRGIPVCVCGRRRLALDVGEFPRRESRASLALSLNASDDVTRTRVMPHNRTWPLASIMKVLREAAAERPRRFFVEYVQLPRVNDSADDARRIADLLRGLDVHVNSEGTGGTMR